MKEDPIFIVGVPRSGTTLLAAMLSAHSRMICGPETHFFRRLSKVDSQQLCEVETWPETAVTFISSIKHSGFLGQSGKYLIDKYELEQTDIENYLRRKNATIPNILSALTEQYMDKMGKSRWVEKTPDHMMHTQLIRQHFPKSPIIRILRDPRDVALSLTRVPWGAKSFLEGLIYWKHMQTVSEAFFEDDKLSYTIRFEDLVTFPQQELRALCQFIDEEYEENMLDTSISGKRVNSRSVPWKDKVSQSLDTNRIAVWRKILTKEENQLAEAMLGDKIINFGYPREESFERLGEFRPTSQLAMKYAEGLKRLTSDGIRFWKANQGEEATVTAYLGDPGKDNWLKVGRGVKIENTTSIFSVLAVIIKAAISSNLIYWVSGHEDEEWTGFHAGAVKKLLAPYKTLPKT